MTFPAEVVREELNMFGQFMWTVRLTPYSFSMRVAAHTKDDAIQIAILTDKCSQLDKRVKELEALLEEPDSNVEQNYTYAPT